MFNQSKKFVCFGEILMDQFPTEKKIGGAPLNVAVWLAKLRQNVIMISGVGNDEDGNKLINYLQENGIETNLIQRNDDLSTGVVDVTVDFRGSATYNIPHPVAWDRIEYTNAMEQAVATADCFFFSTLPARDDVNFNTISHLLTKANYKVLDVNLRAPHYDETVITSFCKSADFIKLNDDELFEISKLYGSKAKSIEENLDFLHQKTDTDTICVTKGKHGAVVYHQGERSYFSGYHISDVVDTVGAGDSFLAAFISKFLHGSDVPTSLQFACGVGAFVASNRGANPSIQNGELDNFLQTL